MKIMSLEVFRNVSIMCNRIENSVTYHEACMIYNNCYNYLKNIRNQRAVSFEIYEHCSDKLEKVINYAFSKLYKLD